MLKGKCIAAFVFLLAISACKPPVAHNTTPAYKTIAFGGFVISVPANWNYVKAQGEAEALILAKITTPHFTLYYNNSIIGEPNTVLYTKQELLQRQLKWMRDCMYCLPGVVYKELDSMDHTSPFILKKRSGNEEPTIKVRLLPKTEIKLVKNTQPGAEAEYAANITHGKTKLSLPIDAPDKSALYNIVTDTLGKYIRQIITPKKGPNGVTGIFFKKPGGDYIFSLTSNNLSVQDQRLALQAFKTIKFK